MVTPPVVVLCKYQNPGDVTGSIKDSSVALGAGHPVVEIGRNSHGGRGGRQNEATVRINVNNTDTAKPISANCKNEV